MKRCARVLVAVSRVLSLHISEMNFDRRQIYQPPGTKIPIFYRGTFSTTNSSVIKLIEISSSFHHERSDSNHNRWRRGTGINPTGFYGTLICHKVHLFRQYGCFGLRDVWCKEVWVVQCLTRRDLGRALFGASTVSHAVFGLVSLRCAVFSVTTFGLRSTEPR